MGLGLVVVLGGGASAAPFEGFAAGFTCATSNRSTQPCAAIIVGVHPIDEAAVQPRVKLRHLRPEDTAEVTSIAARAFDSPTIGATIQSMLGLYFLSGLEGRSVTEQPGEALPREYFAVTHDGGAGERVIGMTGLYRLGTWTWPGNLWLGWTAIDSPLQNQGFGTAMLRQIMEAAHVRGALRMTVETELGGRATGFYLRNGFVEAGRLVDHYGPGLDAAVLSRRLVDEQTTAVGRQRESHFSPLG